jgi:hypothetical protein
MLIIAICGWLLALGLGAIVLLGRRSRLTIPISGKKTELDELYPSFAQDSQSPPPDFSIATRNIQALQEGVVACMEKEADLCALVLLFCWCDVMAASAHRGGDYRASTKKTLAWMERYVLPRLPEKLTAEELWASRHGLLHAFTSESDQVKGGSVREISFTTREDHAREVRQYIERIKASGIPAPDLVVSVHGLAVAVSGGTNHCLRDIGRDPAWREEFVAATKRQFHEIGLVPTDGTMPPSKPN